MHLEAGHVVVTGGYEHLVAETTTLLLQTLDLRNGVRQTIYFRKQAGVFVFVRVYAHT